MAHKDLEKTREYLRQWRKKNPEKCKEYIKREYGNSKETDKKYRIKNAERLKAKRDEPENKAKRKKTNKKYRIKNVERLKAKRRERQKGVIHRDSYCDFETHRELAINSGINESREWWECHKMGFMPDGIYWEPGRAFRRQ